MIALQNRRQPTEFLQGQDYPLCRGTCALAGAMIYRLAPSDGTSGKHIPGNPTIVVENMTGAGSLIAANYTFNSAKPDGLFVGVWNGALILRQALGDKAMRFDGRKLGWIGAPTKGTPFCSIMAHTGLKSWKEVLAANRELKMGSTGPGSTYARRPSDIEPN